MAGKKREAEDSRVQAAFAVIQSIGEKRAKNNHKSECALYGEYIGSQLEKFDDHTRAIVKHEFGNILFQAETGRFKLPSSSQSQWSGSSTPSYVSHPSPSPESYYGSQYQKQQYFTNNWAPAPSPSVTKPTPPPSATTILPVLSQINESESANVDDYFSNNNVL